MARWPTTKRSILSTLFCKCSKVRCFPHLVQMEWGGFLHVSMRTVIAELCCSHQTFPHLQINGEMNPASWLPFGHSMYGSQMAWPWDIQCPRPVPENRVFSDIRPIGGAKTFGDRCFSKQMWLACMYIFPLELVSTIQIHIHVCRQKGPTVFAKLPQKSYT